MALSREVTHRITSARNGNVASRPAPTARPRRPTSTPDQVFSIIRLTSMIRTMSSLNGVDRWDTSRGRGRSRVTDGTVWLLSQIRATRRLACVLACVGLQRRTSGFENNHGGLLPSLEDSISDRVFSQIRTESSSQHVCEDHSKFDWVRGVSRTHSEDCDYLADVNSSMIYQLGVMTPADQDKRAGRASYVEPSTR